MGENMTNFLGQVKGRVQRLALTLISKKMATGTVWSIVATLLLVHKFITAEIWSMMVLSLIGIIFGLDVVQKKKEGG